MIWRIIRSVLAATILVSLSTGCATLFRGSKQTIKVITDPPGVTLKVNDKTYTTPATITLKRNKTHNIVLTKDGYQGFRFNLKANWDAGGAGAVAADAIIPGGSVMFVIDTIAGADRQFNEIATITLPPATQPSPEPILVYEYKGKLLAKTAYDDAVEHDKLFGKKKKKGATQPTTKP